MGFLHDFDTLDTTCLMMKYFISPPPSYANWGAFSKRAAAIGVAAADSIFTVVILVIGKVVEALFKALALVFSLPFESDKKRCVVDLGRHLADLLLLTVFSVPLFLWQSGIFVNAIFLIILQPDAYFRMREQELSNQYSQVKGDT